MGVGEDFQGFCSNLTINNRSTISSRYKAITKRLNLDFWDSASDMTHSLYVGSYGRGTAIRGFSDLDMIFYLPYSYYQKYNRYVHNGQSPMLQDVKKSLQKTYSTTDVGGDGQVVVINFTDGITFEAVPAFINEDGSYTYPDSNDGGQWRVTNPKPEIDAVSSMDSICNSNLKGLCRMMRSWKNKWSVPMGGLLIDTLAHNFIRDWEHRDKSYVYYDWLSRDFFEYLASQDTNQNYWLAAGSRQYVWRKGSFENKAKRCHNIALEAIKYESDNFHRSARQEWRKIYGTTYPS